MTIKLHEFDFLDEFKKQGQSVAEKLSSYQTTLSEAKSRLSELTTMYEITFTSAIEKGEDATVKLQQIDDDIALQKEVVARRERDFTLAIAAMQGGGEISTVDVVEKFCNEFKPMVEAEFIDATKPKLKLARDLIISAMIDHREVSHYYGDIRGEIAELSRSNNRNGLTDGTSVVPHPTDNAPLINRRLGVIKSVRSIIDDIYKQIEGMDILDFEYIAVAPPIKEKAGK